MDAKQAIEVAKNAVTDLFGEDGVGALRLEEIEKTSGHWRVTVGFVRPLALAEVGVGSGPALERLQNFYGPRIYRVVTVRDLDGEVEAVRIRDGLD